MEKILFVDDDVNVLAGLKRLLYPLKKNWEMFFFEDALSALEFLNNNTVDVVITDLLLPHLDGVHFLDMISKKFPNTIRIVLSGYSDEKTIFQIVKTAHQFIHKPVGREELVSRVEKSLKLKEVIAGEKLSGIIAMLEDLPTLPENYLKLEKELQSKDISLARISKIIQNDPTMTGEILRLVNSAFFSFTNEISDIQQAISILGMNKIKSLVLYYEIFKKNKKLKSKLIDLKKLWEHSIEVARLSLKVFKEISPNQRDRDSAYVAGLLHDIGYLTISNIGNYDEIIMPLMKNGLTQYAAEYEAFGVSHAEVGAFVLSVWNLPEPIIKAVAEHHMNSERENLSHLSKIISLSNCRLQEPEKFRERWNFYLTEEQFEKIEKFVNEVNLKETKVS